MADNLEYGVPGGMINAAMSAALRQMVVNHQTDVSSKLAGGGTVDDVGAGAELLGNELDAVDPFVGPGFKPDGALVAEPVVGSTADDVSNDVFTSDSELFAGLSNFVAVTPSTTAMTTAADTAIILVSDRRSRSFFSTTGPASAVFPG